MTPTPLSTVVQMNQIDLTDRTYTITFKPPLSSMVQSIEKIGLIHQPILVQISDAPMYCIVSGLKRILALNYLKAASFLASVYPDNTRQPRLDLFLLNFYENISIRTLNPIEKSLVLNKLLSLFNVSREEIIKTYLPLMKLGSNPKLLDIYLPLIQLEDHLKIAVFEDFISSELAVRLLDYSASDRKAIVILYTTLKLGKNQQKELLRLLHDISQIEGRYIADIIQQPAIQRTLADEKITVSVKTNRIKQILRQMRYPKLVEAENRFYELIKELHLPPNIRLRSAPHFEDDKYTLEISFQKQPDFAAALKILNTISETKKLDQLDFI